MYLAEGAMFCAATAYVFYRSFTAFLLFLPVSFLYPLAKKKELWQYLRKQNLPLYLRLRWGFLGQGMNLPGESGRKVSIAGYKISQKFFGFN